MSEDIFQDDADRLPGADFGGDTACWMHLTCPECGAVKEVPEEDCWRCGSAEKQE